MTQYILTLLITLVERVGAMLALCMLILTLTPIADLGVVRKPEPRYSIILAVVFGCFGILGTYGGDIVYGSYANLRGVYMITAGLLGGPIVGTGAGLIAGGHRYFIDPTGFSSLPCALATVLEGIVAGYVSTRIKGDSLNWKVALVLGLSMETLHQIMVLTMAKPFSQAVDLVQVIAIPMITVNTVGATLFVQSLHMLFVARSRRDSSRIYQILDIANKTVKHLRGGLNRESALATAQIIAEAVPVAAVDIAGTKQVLAHIGAGSDHHTAGSLIQTEGTRHALQTGTPMFLRTREEIGCDDPNCPLTSAAVVPMRKRGQLVGLLKLYGDKNTPLDEVHFELARGLGDLFSTQLELEDIQISNQLLATAEIRRLQAQINPHFLFNALNTIGSFCRTKPDQARSLLSELAQYMRRNIDGDGGLTRLKRELDQVRSYLEIEKARFGDRIKAEVSLGKGVEQGLVPSLIIQPLVENSVKHGILAQEEGGTVSLVVDRHDDFMKVTVSDNGVGMDMDRARELLEDPSARNDEHIGMRNCHQRLIQLFGQEHGLRVESCPGRTVVSFSVPWSS